MSSHRDETAPEPNGAGPTDTADGPISTAIEGLAMRSIGPAFMGGRIADIAIHPQRPSTWYLAVGSGGVWRTINAGTTWEPLFDEQPSYSIGCVRIDPGNPDVIWVGTGEAVSGRHVAWGDGIYRSPDGGRSWAKMGLERSEHISDILIDPRNGDVVYAACEGPLWSTGGQRGLYKTTDGGASWHQALGIDEDTGVTSAVFAPDDPDVIYAASYQRRRRVWSFLAGGPGSAIHRSVDGGVTWSRVGEGLPESDMGRIGLAVTAAAPELVYATIEAADTEERGFYRSKDRGQSWERRNEYLSGGTGPHYYQELFASPTDPHRVYQVDVFIHVTTDGGQTFRNLEENGDKHSDNHVVWIDPADGLHLLVGTDAGLYETFDEGRTWRHFSNLPISQFYRVAVDGSAPFTNILGGAQDLGTLCGPTRTANVDGVRNQDWFVPLGADGYHVAFDPDDPNTSYLEWQGGNAMRHDRRTMELRDIKPQPAPGEPAERWNWDTPIVISPHRSERIYLASQRLWRSDDRGDSWTAISPDLTTDPNRYELATGDRVVSVDSLYDHEAMSHYATITDVSESPLAAGLLYVGTDDGLIHVSEDDGGSWRQAARPPGLPDRAFINDVEASLHDRDAVFVVADDHKSGDYTPYVYRSDDRGRSWNPIGGDVGDRTIAWSIEQDHVSPDVLFLGAEHGLHVSLDRGVHWHRLTKNVPTIAFRDLAVQRRDDDLIGASFGRGFYVLDDYSPLRELTDQALAEPATLFPVRDAWWYVPYLAMQAKGQPTLGSTAFRAENPPFGATFTYHLSEDIKSKKASRRDAEKVVDEAGDDVAFPGWDRLWEEHVDHEPAVLLIVSDGDGRPVRSIAAETSAGLHRTTWDLRHPAPTPVNLDKPRFRAPWDGEPTGTLVAPGRYTVALALMTDQGIETLSEPQEFGVVAVPSVNQADAEPDESAFRLMTSDLVRRAEGAAKSIDGARDRIRHLRAGITAAPTAHHLLVGLDEVHRSVEELARSLSGDPVLEALAEPSPPSIRSSLGRVAGQHWQTTGPPTATQRAAVDRAAEALEPLMDRLNTVVDEELAALIAEFDAAGGSWTPR